MVVRPRRIPRASGPAPGALPARRLVHHHRTVIFPARSGSSWPRPSGSDQRRWRMRCPAVHRLRLPQRSRRGDDSHPPRGRHSGAVHQHRPGPVGAQPAQPRWHPGNPEPLARTPPTPFRAGESGDRSAVWVTRHRQEHAGPGSFTAWRAGGCCWTKIASGTSCSAPNTPATPASRTTSARSRCTIRCTVRRRVSERGHARPVGQFDERGCSRDWRHTPGLPRWSALSVTAGVRSVTFSSGVTMISVYQCECPSR